MSCLLAGQTQRLGKVRGSAVGDPGLGGLADRPDGLLALEQIKAHGDLASDLDARTADLAVAHAGVNIAHGKHGARLADREVDSGPDTVQMIVQVTSMTTRQGVRNGLTVCSDADHA